MSDGKKRGGDAAADRTEASDATASTNGVDRKDVDQTDAAKAAETVEDAVVIADDAAAREDARDEEREDKRDDGAEADRKDETVDETEARDAPAAVAPPPAPEPSWRPAAIGGVVGAVAALIIGPMFNAVLPSGMAMAPESSVAQRFADTRAAITDQASALDGRVAEAASAVEALSADLAAAIGRLEAADAERTAFAETLTSVEGQLEAMNDATVRREAGRADAMDTLRSQVSTLAAAIAATPTPGEAGGEPASAPVATRLALLEGAVRRLEARVNGLSSEALPTPDLTRIDMIEAEVRALKARPVGAAGDAALGLAVAGLSQAVAGTAPYETELETLERVMGREAPLALADPAATGLPSALSLASSFERASVLALEALAKDRAAGQSESWTDTIANSFSALVVVRPTEELEGDGPDAVISRVQARLDEGDIRAAMIELEQLPQVGLDALGPWLEDATRRADAESALAELTGVLLGGE